MTTEPHLIEQSSSAVSRHSIVYNCLTPDPAQSLFFGGGAMGGTVHTPDDSLYLLVSRSDIWNEVAAMGAIAALRLRGTPGLFTTSAARQECRLKDACIELRLQTDQGIVVIEVTCLRDHDLLVIDIHDHRHAPDKWTLSLENWHAGDVTCVHGGATLESVHVNASSTFHSTNASVGVDAAAIGVEDPLLGRAWGLWARADGARERDGALELAAAPFQRIIVATACEAPPSQAEVSAVDLVVQRGRALVAATEEELNQAFQQHRTWWADFWNRSHIRLHSATGEAEYHERLWHVNLFAHACGMGGKYPMRFNGGSYLLDRDKRTWDWGYWGQNMRLVYFPMLAAGHLDFVREYLDWYLGNREFVAAQTKALFGIDGLCWRETQSVWGSDGASTLAAPSDMMHHHFTNNLECCILMDAYYRATGDEDFLEHGFFPALKGILEFFRHYAKRGEDGKYHIGPAAAVEVWPNMVDPQSEICGLRFFLPHGIAWGERFNVSPEVLDGWRDLLDGLADIPVGRWHLKKTYGDGVHDETHLERVEIRADGIYLPAADQTKPLTRRENMENAELYIVFPWGLVHADSSPEDIRRVENTWSHRTWTFQNNGWAQDTLQLVRLGWREEFRLALNEHADYGQRFPSGLFICAAGSHFHGLLTDTPYFDSSGVHLTALEEMMLQCFDGILKLAPAVPLSWSGDCRLHSFDGVQVDLTVRQGLPCHALLTVRRDNVALLLKNHRWEDMTAAIRGKPNQVVAAGELFETRLARGEIVEVTWAGVATAELPAEPLPDVLWPQFKIAPPQAAYRSGHWHDERKGHGQIGLAADGLFPATRRPASLIGR